MATLSLLLASFQATADAATAAWTNPSLGDWFIAGNWVQSHVPNANDEAVVGNGGTALINAPSAVALRLMIGVPVIGGGRTGTLLMGASGANTGGLTVGGDITIGESITAGATATGTVTVSAGARLAQTAGSLYIGQGTQGSTGTLTTSGASSSFQTSAPTFIGSGNSHGNLNVQSGSAVFTGPAELGDASGLSGTSSGAATITGTNSAWMVTGGFTVGYGGSGTVTVSSGGLLAIQGPNNTFSDVSVAAFGGATGSVTVTGTNSRWLAANLFLGGRDGNNGAGFQGGNGSLSITSGGYVQVANLKFFGGSLQVDNGSLTIPGLSIFGGQTPPFYGGPVGDMVVGNTTMGRMDILSGGVVLCN
ncbi:MAG: hypothetical protein M3176_17450, partial [Chloroflexota bacterium]|nr:hypothetical protein [Chloroflexota bacterium]